MCIVILLQPRAARTLASEFFVNGMKQLELGFELLESEVMLTPVLEERIERTADLLVEFGYHLHEINITEYNQSYIRMTLSATEISQAFCNQIGMGFESMKRLLEDQDWYLVQLVWQDRYILSFQVRAMDFVLWRQGKLSTEEFWKKRVIRYVYDLSERRDITEVGGFYRQAMGVVH